MKKNLTRQAFAAFAASAVLAIGFPAPANAAIAIDVAASANLIAAGAAGIVSFDLTCDMPGPGITVFAFAYVTQNVGSGLAYGDGSLASKIPVTCDGTPQRINVTVIATSMGSAFKRGIAVVRAAAEVCDSDNSVCENTSSIEEVLLVR